MHLRQVATSELGVEVDFAGAVGHAPEFSGGAARRVRIGEFQAFDFDGGTVAGSRPVEFARETVERNGVGEDPRQFDRAAAARELEVARCLGHFQVARETVDAWYFGLCRDAEAAEIGGRAVDVRRIAAPFPQDSAAGKRAARGVPCEIVAHALRHGQMDHEIAQRRELQAIELDQAGGGARCRSPRGASL